MTSCLGNPTCHFLYIVNPLIFHGLKMFVRSLVARISQQNTSSRYNLKQSRAIIYWSSDNCEKLGSRNKKRLSSLTCDAERSADTYSTETVINTKPWHTCGVKSLVDLTAAWIPSTVLLLAVPTAAAFSAVAPSLLAWFSKLAALSSNTYTWLKKKTIVQGTCLSITTLCQYL